MPTRIQWRRDAAANWTSVNPLLAEGEMGLETDTKKYKVGDGILHWNALAYAGPRGIFPVSAATELSWDEDYPTNYTEISYVDNRISRVDTWESNAKAVKVFSKVFTYDGGGVLTSVLVTRELSGSRMQKSVNYSGGKPVSVSRVYTP